jgi:hypothetical protein
MAEHATQGADRTGGMRNAGSPTPAVFPPPESMRPTIVGRDFTVSAGHPVVAQVMAEVMARGGTAIDAGVVGGLLSNVVQVDMCNLGGVAPTLIRMAGDETVHVLDGVGPWGAEVTLDAFLARHDGDMPLGSPPGVVPAAFDVWCTALARFGTLRFAEAAAPAIDAAKGGIILDQRTAKALELLGNGFSAYPSSLAVYWPEGRAPLPGEMLVQADLGRTLERLAERDEGTREEGIAAARALFYEGELARELVAFHRETGGWLTPDDLARYRPQVGTAPSIGFRGWRVSTPGMVGQGPVMLQALGILDGLPLEKLARGSADHLHLICEALKQGFAERERALRRSGLRRHATRCAARSGAHRGPARRDRRGQRARWRRHRRLGRHRALRHDLHRRGRRGREPVFLDAQRHDRRGAHRAGTGLFRLAAGRAEPAGPRASGLHRARQASPAHARARDHRQPGHRRGHGDRLSRRRHDRAGHGAERGRHDLLRHDPAAGGRGPARRQLLASRLVLPAPDLPAAHGR